MLLELVGSVSRCALRGGGDVARYLNWLRAAATPVLYGVRSPEAPKRETARGDNPNWLVPVL